MILKNTYTHPSRRNMVIAGTVAAAVVLIGIFFVITRAATLFATAEPESGTTNGAIIVNDAGASGGRAIQFVAQQPTTPPPSSSGKLLQPYGLGFAPYAYIPWSSSVKAAQTGTGAKNYVAAFVLASGTSCTPAWDGDASLGMNSSRGNEIASDFAQVRSAGGDVMVSLGGATGTELAVACKDTAALKQAYRSVIDKYGLTKIDFDVEGATADNVQANIRRAEAVAALQKDIPGLKVWVTLAVDPDGLATRDVAIIQEFRNKGTVLAGINIMVMDYGMGSTQMGQEAIKAATGTVKQLKILYPTNTDAELWKAIGLTAMIGINDTKPETFTLANAKEVHDFAVQKGIGMLSYWNTDRDKACPNNAATLSDSCSGVTQTAWAFAKALALTPSN